jgi:hypothetical protein
LLAFTYRDVPFVIDDYKQATATRDALPRFLHAYSESSSRSRMTRDLKLDRTYPARGILTITGEDYPAGDTGQLGRILLCFLKRGEINTDALTDLQRAGEEGHLAAFLRDFVQEMARELDGRGEKNIQRQFQELLRQDDMTLPGHQRTAGALRQNRMAWLVFSNWLHRVGYITADEAKQLNEAHLAACADMAEGQSAAHSENRLATIFLNVIRELLATREVIIEPEKPECPIHNTPLKQTKEGDWYCDQRSITGICDYQLRRDDVKIIGFQHEHGIAIYPEKTFKIVAGIRAHQGQPLNYSASVVWQQLDSDGLITVKDKKRAPKYKRLSKNSAAFYTV